MTNTNSELLQLATQAKRIASRVSSESESRRLAGRLARDPCDVDALAGATVQLAKGSGIFASYLKEDPDGLLILQLAIAHMSDLCWQDLWNDAHPDRFGQDGEDFELMPVWRERVHAIIKECEQEWVLECHVDDYDGTLIEAGADEGAVEPLIERLLEVRG
jgi:hypothetical protein